MNLRSKFSGLICACLLLFVLKTAGQTTDFYLKNNDRILFYGDSVTEQSFYTNFIETYVVTRFPNLDVSFVNAGWSGDKIWGGDGGSAEERLKRDVFPHQPTVITVMLGMNDGCYIEFNQDCFKAYTENYEKFLALLKKDLPGARLTLLEPSPFDDFTNSNAWRLAPPVTSGYNNVLIRYGQFVKELSQKNGLSAMDMNAPLVEAIQKAQAADPEAAAKIIPDRIHPGAAGGLLMAAALLKTWNAPAAVSKVELDAGGKTFIKSEQTRIADVKFARAISWTQTDAALPLPIDLKDKTIALVARLSNIEDNLNQQILKVGNLKAARWELKIDGETIGIFTKEELASGLNLAIFPTPMFRQAQEVYELTKEHNRIHFVRWREIQVPLEKNNSAETAKLLAGLDALEAGIIKRRKLTAQPKPHQFELIPQD